MRLGEKRKLGIIGGGQLAMFLRQAAESLGIEVSVFVSSEKEPAAIQTSKFVKGSASNIADLKSFFKKVELITFENEFLDVDLLQEAAMNLPVSFLPELESIRVAQDKLTQKKLVTSLGIATSRYSPIHSVADIQNNFKNGEAVLKWSRGGYDGKGTFFWLANKNSSAETAEFLKNSSSAVYAEERIDFVRELAIQVSHSVNGEIVYYPLVVSHQRGGVCHNVLGPAVDMGVSGKLKTQAEAAAKKIAKELPLHGTFAIEFFETVTGELLVNEIAPRVHNSGHHTLTSTSASQFENHIRAVMGLPLKKIETHPFFGMVNLLGPENFMGAKKIPKPDGIPLGELFWYNKSEVRAGRKMGHINFNAKSLAELNQCLDDLCRYELEWVKRL